MNKQIIYGDIGGTKTFLCIASPCNNRQEYDHFEQRYDSQHYESFADMLRNFLSAAKQNKANIKPTAACFAVAGPITDQQAKLTNLPWVINAADIAAKFALSRVKLINDFEAVALAIQSLPGNDLITLQAGIIHEKKMRVVLGAGTGMGVAWLVWQGKGYSPISTEAGHMDFAPANKRQIGLLEFLQKKFGHVSIERVLSGSGLTHIFNFLQAHSDISFNQPQITLEEDSGATVSALAENQKHPIAIQSLDLFAEIYGAYAGNLALAGLCRSGVYIAGGIAPRIIDTLNKGGFIQAFRDKGRFSELMSEIPVHVITNPKANLLGAEQAALSMLEQFD